MHTIARGGRKRELEASDHDCADIHCTTKKKGRIVSEKNDSSLEYMMCAYM
jgi:hypothetical protein